jgi:hypothetical protein
MEWQNVSQTYAHFIKHLVCVRKKPPPKTRAFDPELRTQAGRAPTAEIEQK